jgi:hypothetical protein
MLWIAAPQGFGYFNASHRLLLIGSQMNSSDMDNVDPGQLSYPHCC